MATTLGIDIGQRSIRGALLRTSLRSHQVERYLEIPVSPAEPDGEAAPERARLRAVQELIQALGTQPDSIVVALDGRRASLRHVEIPALAKKRAHEVLPFELEPVLPFAVEDAVIDFQETGARGDQVSLLAAAVPENVIAETLEEFTHVSVTPRELAVGAAALDGLSPFLAQPADEPWILVHLDADHIDVAILRNGAVQLARTLDEGADALRARPQAVKFSLHQTLMKYRADGGALPTKLFVLGEAANDALLVGFIGSSLGITAEPLPMPSASDASSVPSAAFGKALALAGRVLRRGKRIDVRRGKFAVPRGVSQLREYAWLAVACATAIVFSYGFSVWAEYRVLAQERDALSEMLGAVTEARFGEKATSVKRARELLEGGGARKDPLPRFDAFRALGAVSAAVPQNVQHDTRELEIELDETGQTGKLHLEGQLQDLAARDQVAEAIEAHECIDELERGKTSSMPGQDRKNYTLEGTIGCPGAAPAKKGKDKARTKRGD